MRLRIGDQTLTAVITRDAVEELKLRRGDEALAIVKSTEVMIAREAATPPAHAAAPRKAARPPPPLTRQFAIAYSDVSMFAVHHHARHHFHHGHGRREQRDPVLD